jgi:hypothetical protein
MAQATEEEAHAHNKEQVGQDRSEHRRLNNFDLIILQRHDTDLFIKLVLRF